MTKIEVLGTLGKDPELKFVQGKNGQFAVTEFSIADSQRENKNGEWADGLTVWYKVSILGKDAEIAIDQLNKGTRVRVSGTLKITEYTAKDGTVKQSFEIKATDVSLPLQKSKPTSNSFVNDLASSSNELGW